MGEVLFNYRKVTDVPLCPCNNPGDYMMFERVRDLNCLFRCWCGKTMKATFDTEEELAEFIAKHAG